MNRQKQLLFVFSLLQWGIDPGRLPTLGDVFRHHGFELLDDRGQQFALTRRRGRDRRRDWRRAPRIVPFRRETKTVQPNAGTGASPPPIGSEGPESGCFEEVMSNLRAESGR